MEVKRPQISAVIARTDADDAGPAGGTDARGHRVLDGGLVDAVDDNFVNRANIVRQCRLHHAPQRGTVSVVGAGPQHLVAAADLAPGADDAAGERHNYAWNLADRLDRRLGGMQSFGLILSQDQEVAAADAFDRAESVLAQKLAVHDRQAPVTAAGEFLAELPAVAEETQVAADANRLVLDDGQSVVTSGRRAGENALPDAIDSRFLQRVAVEGEEENAEPRPAVRRFVRRQYFFDARFNIAADDARGVTGGDLPGGEGPVRSLGGNDQPRRGHWKCFGESFIDEDVVHGQHER